jgi:cell division protease FtsH
VIERNYNRANQILTDNMDKLHLMSEALMKYETIDTKQIDDIMAGKTPRPPSDWSDEGPTSGPTAPTGEQQPSSDSGSGKIGDPASLH